MSTYLDYPYNIDGRGRTATAARGAHIRDLIEQVLFTSPGERVNRPDFGCGLLALVFAPNSAELAAASQFLVQASLQQWLSDVIVVEGVSVEAGDSRLRVVVQYVVKRAGAREVAEFSR